MRQSKATEMWVGLFVALGLVALFFLAMKVSNLADYETTDGYLIKANFENVGSLKVRAPVSMSGVRVGRVSNIYFDKKKFQAVVEMRIDPLFDNLPEDTTASVLTAGLLGEQYISLSPGGSDDVLKNGSVVDLTQSAIVLEEVVSKFLYNKAEGDKKASDKSPDKKDDAAAGG
ncbi:outer membrane lipid asymmetry maintenance protein MlaD [Methylogaea oryzae]|uniref:Outer membrane lipid asymmetry maintenance protein MlaD n=1 Tax=Methylogaea oryzae TaxID=1295382 RepID=A0A8D5AMK8_9GAMM|nr:outer membrane lipid asymmetry maintenance protein MlaD [Methylogaea oryzae]BBL71190.1 outer membrane lipid asymmetry maintenance protein MlaD [Methylogaea oryzae]